MIISLIVAMDKKGIIGKNNQLPWKLSADLKHFKQLTIGKPIIMGRKTFESIPPKFRPLRNRLNIVVTNQRGYPHEGIYIASSINETLSHLKTEVPIAGIDYGAAFVIGGESIYRQTISLADRLEITRIHKRFDGDAFFPQIDENIWNKANTLESSDEGLEYSFVTYTRRK